MPIHDWTRVDAGIFHAFHHDWISAIAHALNRGLLPGDYYALPEQISGKYGPDVLTLQGPDRTGHDSGSRPKDAPGENGGGVLTLPKLKPTAETDMEFYRRRQKVVAIRHVSDDQLVAMVEIVSPGNKAGRKPLRASVEKAADLLDQGIHLLIIDLHRPTKLNPEGIHGEIWQDVSGSDYVAPKDKPLTLAAYENGSILRLRGPCWGGGCVERYAALFGAGEIGIRSARGTLQHHVCRATAPLATGPGKDALKRSCSRLNWSAARAQARLTSLISPENPRGLRGNAMRNDERI